MIPVPSDVLFPPVAFQELKHKPGRRTTWRATPANGGRTAIVKRYASNRAPLVASRLAALASGPCPPHIPAVLHVDPEGHVVVLSDVPGQPLRHAVLAGDTEACRRAGEAVGRWHQWWRGRSPAPLRPQTAERELELLVPRAETTGGELGRAVVELAARLAGAWECSTVVHRDVYEEQLLVGPDGEIGLIDLDDVALGPAELDLGNLVAHLELLALRTGRRVHEAVTAFLAGHAAAAGDPDPDLLDRCRRLTLLRLACIHREPALLELARSSPAISSRRRRPAPSMPQPSETARRS